MVIKKVELLIEVSNDFSPEEINDDITFKYLKMHNGEYEINSTKYKVIECNVSDVI